MNRQIDTALELKSLTPGGEFEGYGSIFHNVDSYADVVAPGAFQKTLSKWALKGRMPSLLWQHRQDEPIGAYSEMHEDENGLYVKGQLCLDCRQGAEAYALMKMGAISGLSIGFIDDVSEYDAARQVRVLKEVDLWEVSLVTFPANDEARIGAVKAALKSGGVPSPKDFERFLRDAGFSRTQAKQIMAEGYKSLTPLRDAEDPEQATEALKNLLKHFV